MSKQRCLLEEGDVDAGEVERSEGIGWQGEDGKETCEILARPDSMDQT